MTEMFSQRIGASEINKKLQLDGITDELRNCIWNLLTVFYFSDEICYNYKKGYTNNTIFEMFSFFLWHEFFKKPADERPRTGYVVVGEIKKNFFLFEWYEVYDFLEFIIMIDKERFNGQNKWKTNNFINNLNSVLDENYSGYRVINNLVSPISNSEEIDSINNAMEGDDFSSARNHIKKAIGLLSVRGNPDVHNSIKESISAVESISWEISGNAKGRFSEAMKILHEKHGMHKAFTEGLAKIYGYASDAGGVRHASTQKLDKESSVDFDDAKFMLVFCSSVVNFMASKFSKNG